MRNPDPKTKFSALLAQADIQLNGTRPWDIQVHDQRLYRRIMRDPSLEGGEAYMDGWWDCEHLDEFFFRLMRFADLKKLYKPWPIIKNLVKNSSLNQQSKQRSKRVAKIHYNLGNDLYCAMLGESMAYTCAYYKDTTDLNTAQLAKYDLICRKVGLKSGEKILELGCGFGGFAKYAAQNYGVEVVAVNISTEQMKFARESCQGLPIKLYTCDYRDVKAYNPEKLKFDKIISIGMCEHVGYRNYSKFLAVARNNLHDDGLFLLHTIGKNISLNFTDPWIQKYIFPQGMLPSIKWLSAACEGKFVIEDLHNFGASYDKTLMAWHTNFIQNWPHLKSQYYDDRFYRMWCFYLLSCAGAFRARNIHLWQLVLSPQGVIDGYNSIR